MENPNSIPIEYKPRCSIYYLNNGDFEYNNNMLLDNKGNNVFYFRKYITKYAAECIIEHTIAKIIKKNPHPNIVTVYEVTDSYIDMELLNMANEHCESFTAEDYTILLNNMRDALNHLHSHNIVYYDLKLDNIGLQIVEPNTKVFKLLDFDMSGIIDEINNKKWDSKIEPYIHRSISIGILDSHTNKETNISKFEIDTYKYNLFFKEITNTYL